MSRIKELEEQITKLQEEKSKIYSDERKAVLIDIKEKSALFEFTAKELGLKLEKTLVGRKSRKEEKIARKKTASKKLAKKASRKPTKVSGVYFDLDGRKVPAGRGRPPKEVTVYAASKGVSTNSLKRNADGSPHRK